MKKDNSKIIIILLVIIIALLIMFIALMVSGKIKFNINNDDAISYNVNDYVIVEKVDWNTDRTSVEKVIFKNLDSSLVNDFIAEQTKFLSDAKKSYDFYSSQNFESLGNVNTVVSTNIWYQVNGKLLTVYYEIINEEAIGTCSDVAVINIDLESKKVVTDAELLKLANQSFKSIALSHYNNAVESYRNYDHEIQDKDGNLLSFDEFNANRDNYLGMIESGLDSVIYAYVQNGKIKYDYGRYSIDMLYLTVGKGGCFDYITVELGDY